MDRTTELSWEDVTRRIKGRMLDLGVRTVDNLTQLTGINRSSLSLKMTGKRKFRLEDLQTLASALQTTVAYLIGETDQIGPLPDTVVDTITPPHPELSRRLAFLEAPEADRAGTDSGIPFPVAELEAIALRHDVPIEYLTELSDPAAADHFEALIEFSRAAQDSGVQRIAARSLGALSSAELRALARVIKRQ